ncbi:MAG: hypothetical protein H7A23_15380 [Leptospiraceae bacterium]|nr:hypothetical protein [Leptospiraceae bacterium]MCP5495932.1 hypothetical protein [Leptospiraceae bacterium]
MDKKQIKVSCEHSYKCNCKTECYGSGKDRSCSRTCSTCYSHSYDYDWIIVSSIETIKEESDKYSLGFYSIDIPRVDRQGIKEPSDWTKIRLKEPMTLAHKYTNHLKNNKFSLFSSKKETEYPQYKAYKIDYPEIYNHIKISNFINVNLKSLEIHQINTYLMEVNSEVGPGLQGNLILILSKDLGTDFADFVLSEWDGGNKNDIITFVNLDLESKINWVYIHCLAEYSIFEISLRNKLLDYKNPILSEKEVKELISNIKETAFESYKRKPMADFEKSK